MGLFTSKNGHYNKTRKFYVDLLSSEIIKQPEEFCNNSIKTTHYTM